MSDSWTEQRLQQYIDDEVPESLSLEYKRGTVLSKNAKKNPKWLDELTKDISALANSAGGILIYGIAENNDKPTGFAPVDKTEFSRETLDQIISSNIKPRIEGLIIHPVTLSSGENDIVYVIEIPQSNTAHQAYDKRYHKRLNTTTESMEDYEIRDVMGREKHPNIIIHASIAILKLPEFTVPSFADDEDDIVVSEEQELNFLMIEAHNVGSIYANYVNVELDIPHYLLHLPEYDMNETPDWKLYKKLGLNKGTKRFYKANTERDQIGKDTNNSPIFSAKRYVPILPSRLFVWKIPIRNDIFSIDIRGLYISWVVNADNAQQKKGTINCSELETLAIDSENVEEFENL